MLSQPAPTPALVTASCLWRVTWLIAASTPPPRLLLLTLLACAASWRCCHSRRSLVTGRGRWRGLHDDGATQRGAKETHKEEEWAREDWQKERGRLNGDQRIAKPEHMTDYSSGFGLLLFNEPVCRIMWAGPVTLVGTVMV